MIIQSEDGVVMSQECDVRVSKSESNTGRAQTSNAATRYSKVRKSDLFNSTQKNPVSVLKRQSLQVPTATNESLESDNMKPPQTTTND